MKKTVVINGYLGLNEGQCAVLIKGENILVTSKVESAVVVGNYVRVETQNTVYVSESAVSQR